MADPEPRGRVWRVARGAALAMLAGTALWVVPQARNAVDGLVLAVGALGGWGPPLFVAVCAAGICLWVPSSVFTAAAAVAFGPYWGFLWAWSGACLGGAGAYWMARWLGGSWAARFAQARWAGLGDRLRGRNGLALVALLRLGCVPFTPVSFVLGLTGVRFRDYLLGTALGSALGTFAFTFAVSTAWKGLGGSAATVGWQGAGAAALLVLAFGAAFLARRRRVAPGR